jgi:hypothetical protein
MFKTLKYKFWKTAVLENYKEGQKQWPKIKSLIARAIFVN